MTSIRGRLLLGLLSGMLVVQLAIYYLIYARIEDEIDELFDAELERSALSVVPAPAFELPVAPPAHKVDNPLAGMIITVWNDAVAAPIYQSGRLDGLSRDYPAGFSKRMLGGRQWRLFAAAGDGRLVIAAQPTAVHLAAARQITLRTLLPSLAILPLAACVIALAVYYGLRPLARMTAELRLRSHRDLSPLDDSRLPADIAPVVVALNDLMSRLDGSLARQRRFIADAAHELLTPLSAVRLQAQLLARAAGTDRRHEALSELQGGIARTLHLARQLLALARHEADSDAPPPAEIDLAELVRQVVDIHRPLAEAKAVRLDARLAHPVPIRGDADGINTLVSNLVENAIKYTEAGGQARITVTSIAGAAMLEVEDSGPGIPADERERVFDRFYRRPHSPEGGSGLGLAIAREIAERHEAVILLSTSADLGGLQASVRFRR